MASAADELADFQSNPVQWLEGKLTNRGGRENDAARAMARQEALELGVNVAILVIIVRWLDRA